MSGDVIFVADENAGIISTRRMRMPFGGLCGVRLRETSSAFSVAHLSGGSHLPEEPRPRIRPVALRRRHRDAEHIGGFLDGEAHEVTQLHQLGLAGVVRLVNERGGLERVARLPAGARPACMSRA